MPNQHKNESFNQLLYHSQSKILGHRGARGEHNENSKTGFEHAQLMMQASRGKFVGIEFDVQLTKDNKLVVFHDDNLDRIYKQQCRVDSLPYSTLQRMTANLQPVLLLNEMPLLLDGYNRIELEIKTHHRTNYQHLTDSLNRTLKLNAFLKLPIVLTSFDVTLLQCLKRHNRLSKLPRGLLVEPQSHASVYSGSNAPIDKIPYLAKQLGCAGIGLYYEMFDPKVVSLSKRLNLSTTAWTVNHKDDASKLIKQGVDYIITDYPTNMLGIKTAKI